MKYDISDFELKVGDLDIKCRPWTSLEERKFISIKNDNTSFIDLAKNMILPNIEYKPMTLDEFKYLSFKMRALSVNPELDFNYLCSGETGCQRTISKTTELEDLLHLEPSKLNQEQTIEYKDIKIEFRKIVSKELLLKVLEEKDLTEQKYLEFLACIKSVTYKDQEFKSFTFEEIKEFFDSVEVSKFKKLYYEFFKIKGHLEVYTESTCPICKKTTRVTFDSVDPMDFL